MKKFLIAMVLGLGIGAFAHASEGKVVVECNSTVYSDIVSIQIRETAKSGRYELIENRSDNGKRTSVVSGDFGMKEIEASQLPALSDWNGYSRTFLRQGEGSYAIVQKDECETTTFSLSCKESL